VLYIFQTVAGSALNHQLVLFVRHEYKPVDFCAPRHLGRFDCMQTLIEGKYAWNPGPYLKYHLVDNFSLTTDALGEFIDMMLAEIVHRI